MAPQVRSEEIDLEAAFRPFLSSRKRKRSLPPLDCIMKSTSHGDARGMKRRRVAHRKPSGLEIFPEIGFILPAVPVQPMCIKRSHDSLLIAWRGSQKQTAGTCYRIEIRRHLESSWHAVSEAYHEERICVSGLEPHTVYLLRICARYGSQNSKWSDEAMFETLPARQTKVIHNVSVVATNNSVSLFWKNECKDMINYDVHELRHGAWTTVLEAQEQLRMQASCQRQSPCARQDTLWFVRRNVLPGTKYAFRIIAKEGKQYLCSQPIHVETEGPVLSPRHNPGAQRSSIKFPQPDVSCNCEATALLGAHSSSEMPDMPCAHVSCPMLPLTLISSEASPDSITVQWDALVCPAMIEYAVQTTQLGEFCLHPGWDEHRCSTSSITLESLRSSTFYLVRVAPVCMLCNNFISEWSDVIVLPTKTMDQESMELRKVLQRFLHCKKTSQMIISRLMKSHLTLEEVKKMPRRVLEQHLKELQVKEGGVFAVTYALHGEPFESHSY